jgi:hypothetical protein
VLGVPRGIRFLIPRVPNRLINRSETISAVRSNQLALSPTFATMMHQSSKKRFNCSKLYFHLKHTDLAGVSPESAGDLAGDHVAKALCYCSKTKIECSKSNLTGDLAGDAAGDITGDVTGKPRRKLGSRKNVL